jgi:hypothetical protein
MLVSGFGSLGLMTSVLVRCVIFYTDAEPIA